MTTDFRGHCEVESREKWGAGKEYSDGEVIEDVQQGGHSGERKEEESKNDGEENHLETGDAELNEFLRNNEPSQVFSYQSSDIRGRGMHKFLVKVYGRMTLDQVVHKMRRIISDFNFQSGCPPGPRPIPMIIRRLPRGHPGYDPEMDAEPDYGLDPITLQRLRESRLSPTPSERNVPTLGNQESVPHKDLPIPDEHENRPECTLAGSMLLPGNLTIHPSLPSGPLTGSKRVFEDMEIGQHVEHTNIARETEAISPNTLVVNPVCTSIAASAEILSPSPTAREILEQVVYTQARGIPALDIEFVTPPEERGLGVMEESSTASRGRRRYDLRPRDMGRYRWGSRGLGFRE